MEFAGRCYRFLAFVIDFLVLLVIMAVLNATGIIDTNPFDDTEEVAAAAGVAQAAVAFGYFFLLTAAFGATLGKMAMGMKVVDRNGNKPGAGPVLVREVTARALGTIITLALGAGIGEFVGLVVSVIIVIMILFDEKRQGLHDRIGGTYVVKAQ